MRSISFSLSLAMVLVFAVVSSMASHSRTHPSSATATVEIGKQIAEVWPRIFRGFTADWWRHNNPGNGDRWQWAGMLTLDLGNTRLRNLTKALAPAIWRIGGSPEDSVVYAIGDPPECATPEAINKSINYPGPLCVTMQRWGEIIEFVNYTGVKLAFGLNGLYQRHHHTEHFNSTNAREFLRYTASEGFPVYAFELSNEDNHGQVDPKILAEDFGTIRSFINEFWPTDDETRPLLFGPDVGQHFKSEEDEWLASFIEVAAPYLNASTVHTYCNTYTSSVCDTKTVNASQLATCTAPEFDFMSIVHKHAPKLPVMAGEVGPHSHGGLNGCTNRFANSFWYLEVLGSLASRGVVAFARSTLIGGWYEMINKTTFEPNPDYYAALLWGYMMGYEHLNVSVTGSSAVHAFASYTDNGIVAVILNTDAKNDVMVTVNHVQLNSHPDDQEQIEYHIRAHNNDPFSDKVEILLSSGEWQVLEASDEGVPPQLGGITNKLQPINMPAMSYAFVRYPQ